MTRPRSVAPADLDDALWRAVAVFRVAALAYALVSIGVRLGAYDDDAAALVVAGVMVVWTGVMVAVPHGRGWFVADLAVAIACQQATVLALSDAQVQAGDPTLPVCWVAVPVVGWAVLQGWRTGLAAALVVSAGAVVERGGASQATVNSCVLLVLGGTLIGYLVELGRRAEQAYAEAVRLRAETSERERLARSVHDGVLQALALVARRSGDAELVELARGQEQALRRLVTEAPELPVGETDLRTLLPARAGVEVAAPATPVLLPAADARCLADAVVAAVDNALQHGGTTAWVLVEDLGEAVVVSVRDDGPGIPEGRLEQAASDGRLGVSQSIRGRVADLGGTVTWHSTPGQGTEVEIRVATGGG